MKRQLILFFLLVLSVNISGQDFVKGRVISSDDQKSLPNVMVKSLDYVGDKILAYAFTSNDGTFLLSTKNSSKDRGLIIEFSFLGYETKRVNIKDISNTLNIQLSPQFLDLREVVVKAPLVKMKGDTIDYTTAQLVRVGDRNIGDVLKRIPGIEVSENGEIKYKERPINAFYVDGKNLLGNQYGLATNNIAPDIVSMIQVFDKHEPIKALGEVSTSQSAAINLTIKKDARSKYIGRAHVGIGASPNMWRSDVTLLNFGEAQQHMLVYNGNNSGDDVKSQLNMFTINHGMLNTYPDYSGDGVLNLSALGEAPLDSKRSLFNKSHLLSANTLIPLGRDFDGVIKAGYIYDIKSKNSIQLTEYAVDGEILDVEEKSLSKCSDKIPMVDFTLTSNKESIYFQNRINGRIKSSANWGLIGGTKSVDQSLKRSYYDVSEIITLVKPIKRIALKFNSRTQFRSLPEILDIKSDSVKQEVDFKQIKSENIVSTQFRWKRGIPILSAGYNFLHQKFKSWINDTRAIQIFHGENDIILNLSEIFISPAYKFDYSIINGILSLPIKMNMFEYRSPINRETANTIDFLPTVSITAPLFPFVEATLFYSGGESSLAKIQQMNYDYILTNYRTISKGFSDVIKVKSQNVRMGIKYSNPLKLIFIAAGANYLNGKGGVINSYEYLNYLTTLNLLPNDNQSNTTTSYHGKVSKMFFDLPITLNCSLNYSLNRSNYMQQSIPVMLKSRNFKIKAGVEWHLDDWLNAELSLEGGKTTRTSDFGADYNSSQINSFLDVKLKISQRLKLFTAVDYYRNQTDRREDTNTLFADIKLIYKTSFGDFEVLFTNILNSRDYSNTSYSDVKKITGRFELRPRSIMALYSFNF